MSIILAVRTTIIDQHNWERTDHPKAWRFLAWTPSGIRGQGNVVGQTDNPDDATVFTTIDEAEEAMSAYRAHNASQRRERIDTVGYNADWRTRPSPIHNYIADLIAV